MLVTFFHWENRHPYDMDHISNLSSTQTVSDMRHQHQCNQAIFENYALWMKSQPSVRIPCWKQSIPDLYNGASSNRFQGF